MLRGAPFSSLHALLDALDRDRWPSREALTALAAAHGVATASGHPVRFVAPRVQRDRDGLGYEARIATTGEVATREGNWHDVLNALCWVAFPQAKSALSAAHAMILAAGGEAEARRRGPARDALTLFDEGGVVFLAGDERWLDLVRAHDWRALFWQRRAALRAEVCVLAFGHALLESMLAPFVGITARAFFLRIDAALLAAPAHERLAFADAVLADALRTAGAHPSRLGLAPLPVLGLPGWHAAGEAASFYDDTGYFRPHPSARGAGAQGPVA